MQSLLTAKWPLELQHNRHSCIQTLQDVYLSVTNYGDGVAMPSAVDPQGHDDEILDLSQVDYLCSVHFILSPFHSCHGRSRHADLALMITVTCMLCFRLNPEACIIDTLLLASLCINEARLFLSVCVSPHHVSFDLTYLATSLFSLIALCLISSRLVSSQILTSRFFSSCQMAISESQVEPQSIIMWGLRVRMAVATGAVEGVKVHYKSLVHGSDCNNKSWIPA